MSRAPWTTRDATPRCRLLALGIVAAVGRPTPPRAAAGGPVGDDVVMETRTTRRDTPPGFDALVDYDLRAACADNARTREAG